MTNAKLYARAPSYGVNCYFTPGRLYLVENIDGPMFQVRDDDGRLTTCLWNDCAHIDFQIWTAARDDDRS